MRKALLLGILLVMILTGCNGVEDVVVSAVIEPTTIPSIPTIPPTPIPTIPVVVASDPPVEAEPVFFLSDYERWVAECMVMGESGSESYEGQVLVAQCILNACLKDRILPSQVRVRYKYSGWNEYPTESVKQAVSAVFDDGYQITNEPILYFYAPKYSAGRFHETQCHVITVGGHKFFKEWEDWN